MDFAPEEPAKSRSPSSPWTPQHANAGSQYGYLQTQEHAAGGLDPWARDLISEMALSGKRFRQVVSVPARIFGSFFPAR